MRAERLTTRQIVRRFYRSWWRRPLWLLAALIVPLIVGRIVLTPLLKATIRQHLDRTVGPAMVSFRDLDIFLFPPTFIFKEVAIHGGETVGAGDDLAVERLEVHVASLRELTAVVPKVRMRMVRPHLRLHASGAHDLVRIARALPTARVEVTSLEGGTISAAADAAVSQPLFDGVSGDIEGLATGAEVGRGGWQLWSDGRLLARDPIHAFVKSDTVGAWQATVTLQELPGASPVTSSPATAAPLSMSIDARLHGSDARTQGIVHAAWSAEDPPRLVAEDMLRALPETWSWSGGSLLLAGLKEGAANVGRSVDLAVETDATKANVGRFRAFDLVGLLVNVLRVVNQAVLPPPTGMAALTDVGTNDPAAPPPTAGEAVPVVP